MTHNDVGDALMSPPDPAGALAAYLAAHELIKVRLHEPEDKQGMADALAGGTASTLCGLVGHTAILYKKHPTQPRSFKPQAPEKPAKRGKAKKKKASKSRRG